MTIKLKWSTLGSTGVQHLIKDDPNKKRPVMTACGRRIWSSFYDNMKPHRRCKFCEGYGDLP